jgi:hypothetical protein
VVDKPFVEVLIRKRRYLGKLARHQEFDQPEGVSDLGPEFRNGFGLPSVVHFHLHDIGRLKEDVPQFRMGGGTPTFRACGMDEM